MLSAVSSAVSAFWRRRPPSMPVRSLVSGNLRDLVDDSLNFYRRCEAHPAGIVQIRIYRRPLFVVTAPALIEEILTTQNKRFEKGIGLADLKPLFGDGLLTADHDVWRAHRKVIGPHFPVSKLEASSRTIADCTSDLLAGWQSGETRDVYRDMTRLGLRVVVRTLFGRDLPGADEQAARMVAVLQWCQKELAHFGDDGKARFDAAIAELDAFAGDVIEQLRADPGDGADLVNTLLRAQRANPAAVTDAHIRDQVVTMLLAGYETTATALAWTLYLLARHPASAARLRDELDDALAEKPLAALTPGDAPYLMQVVCESLRLYPPAHRISRRATEAVQLGGYDFAAGTDFVVPQWAVQRSPRHYRNPESFAPERWTPEMRGALPRFAFFPFAGGPRRCIGESLAMRELLLIVGAIAHVFELSPASAREILPYEGITLVPEGGALPLRVRARPPALARASA